MDDSSYHLPADKGLSELAESWPEFFGSVGLGREAFSRFRTIVYHYYMHHEREFSWRSEITPYRVVVSEVMLQQTQTVRVAGKFEPFVSVFPDFSALAGAPFVDVLRLWKGLGYNRRARYLHELAKIVTDSHRGILPDDPQELVRLPGIGPATAASICVFAYDRPLPFIETNIRTVFLHFFFRGREQVHDREIMPLVEASLDRTRPRQWFYALMDYGVMLKKTVGNLNRVSRHYTKQSRFEGSDRQLRGRILQLLLDRQMVTEAEIGNLLDEPGARVARVAAGLCEEGIIVASGGGYRLD